MNDNELGLELAEIVRKEQEEATMLHREQKDVAETDIPKRHKIDWEALTEEEYGSGGEERAEECVDVICCSTNAW